MLGPRTDETKQWANMTVGDVAAATGQAPGRRDARHRRRRRPRSTTFFSKPAINTSLEGFRELMTDEYLLPGISDGGAHTKFLTAGRYPTETIIRAVRDHDILSLEEAHWKLSALPARCAGFDDRGTLEPGKAADIVVYDLDRLDMTPVEKAYDFPGDEWRRIQRGRRVPLGARQRRGDHRGRQGDRGARRPPPAPPGGGLMGALDGRVAIVTGAGRGMGREHALLFAEEGAKVVVNDNGAERDGTGTDPLLAKAVVDEIRTAGGDAVASDADVTTMDGAKAVLDRAIEDFGDVHAVVNNAGILRDRMFVNMTEDDWDAVIRGHLRSHFCMTRQAAGYWRDKVKAGEPVNAAVVNVSSTSGLLGQVGQSNYGAAKAGIASMTIILAEELGRYGVRVNTIVPVARTRMTEEVAGIADLVRKPDDPAEFDTFHPGNVSPLVAYLATADCPHTGRVLMARGSEIRVFRNWSYASTIEHDARWGVDELSKALADLDPA